jgi:hypothetical protein
MLFGHNTNLKSGNVTFHVQTEDRGESHAMIDTTVYYHGRVLHRRTNNYFDLLPLNEDREQALRLRLDEQHRTVIDEIRSGALVLTVPPAMEPASPVARGTSSVLKMPIVNEPRKLLLELVNAKSWLAGKRASLQIAVREHSGAPIPGAKVRVEIEGGETAEVYTAQTGLGGEARIEFELPGISGAEPALVINAEDQDAKTQLRFALRAKPRVPSL